MRGPRALTATITTYKPDMIFEAQGGYYITSVPSPSGVYWQVRFFSYEDRMKFLAGETVVVSDVKSCTDSLAC